MFLLFAYYQRRLVVRGFYLTILAWQRAERNQPHGVMLVLPFLRKLVPAERVQLQAHGTSAGVRLDQDFGIACPNAGDVRGATRVVGY